MPRDITEKVVTQPHDYVNKILNECLNKYRIAHLNMYLNKSSLYHSTV